MDIYTLFLSTALNLHKELPVRAGLTLNECRTAAFAALQDNANFARCRPAEPLVGPVFIRLSNGRTFETIRSPGGKGYDLPSDLMADDLAQVYGQLGKPSSGVHSDAHVNGPAKVELTAATAH
ncbi:hypothetical protein [Pseudomonas sp. KNUC1026]|uniref:hypothetical protein n=1 Tax=Pseudomonas sp. KNUC1026 TaxID=2893890 RepID=UPI001F29D5A3|nr:hypothetical protein [Pseudomonas sp. KNUC1026]UFH51227.1 hypothetical protein LN139_09470 [Pseudomonas sp. KNUC1026]